MLWNSQTVFNSIELIVFIFYSSIYWLSSKYINTSINIDMCLSICSSDRRRDWENQDNASPLSSRGSQFDGRYMGA